MIKLPTKKRIDSYKNKVSAKQLQSDLDAAQEYLHEMLESSDIEKGIALLEKAFKKSPLCADAYCIYCDIAGEPLESQIAIKETALYAAKIAIGEEFEEFAGHFWGLTETRPYMRTKASLAETLWEAGKFFPALTHYKEMLELNPNDNQGIRHLLSANYLELEMVDDLVLLLNEYPEDHSPPLQYSRALIAYRNSALDAEEIAKIAIRTNQYVPELLEKRCVQPSLNTGYITYGGMDEAIDYVNYNIKPWLRTPGAIDWIKNQFISNNK